MLIAVSTMAPRAAHGRLAGCPIRRRVAYAVAVAVCIEDIGVLGVIFVHRAVTVIVDAVADLGGARARLCLVVVAVALAAREAVCVPVGLVGRGGRVAVVVG